jgi:hypothetical protein
VGLYFTGVDVFLCPASSRRTGRMSAVFPTLFYTFRKLRERFRGGRWQSAPVRVFTPKPPAPSATIKASRLREKFKLAVVVDAGERAQRLARAQTYARRGSWKLDHPVASLPLKMGIVPCRSLRISSNATVPSPDA